MHFPFFSFEDVDEDTGNNESIYEKIPWLVYLFDFVLTFRL